MQKYLGKAKRSINIIKLLLLSSICLFLVGCSGTVRDGDKLSSDELAYIKKLGLLDEDEKIIQFASQSDFEQSGNIISTKRLASYWIDDKPYNTSIKSAYYGDIAEIESEDQTQNPFNASYLEVTLDDGSNFMVYVDASRDKTEAFFKLAIHFAELSWAKEAADQFMKEN